MKHQSVLILTLALASIGRHASAQTTATNGPIGFLNVQGVLHDNGQPVNGFMWFCWDFYATPTGGTPLAHDTNMTQVMVSNGLANVTYNLGNVAALGLSPTQDLYLQIDVSPTGEPGSFTVLGPRQRIVPSLFASMAVRAEEAKRLIGPLTDVQIPSDIARDSEIIPILLAAGGAGSGLDADLLDGMDSTDFALASHDHDDRYWKLEGNAGTVPGLNFLGTTDTQPLELKVNSQRALRLEPYLTVAPNLIAGSSANAVVGTEGASILGGHLNLINAGALFSVIGGGAENLIDLNAESAVVAGGRRNTIQADAKRSTIGGGATNTIQTFTDFATIAGGANNSIFPDTDWATIGGGRTNVIMNGSAEATISGGGYHFIANGCEAATISGGFSNRLTQAETTIGGGKMNTIHSGQGTIGGGLQNKIETTANFSTIGGGTVNLVNPDSPGATIGGGVSNKVDQAAVYGTVTGGYSNVVGRPAGAISGGERNFVAGLGATIAGGIANQVQLDARASVISGGAANQVQPYTTNAVIAGGLSNIVHSAGTNSANFSTIGGGRDNHIDSTAQFATIPGGRGAKAINFGQLAHASGGFGGQQGTAQESFHVLRGSTTGAATNELFLDGLGERLRVLPGTTLTFDILVAARSNGGSAAGYQYRGVIESSAAGLTAFVGTVDTVMTKEGVAAWNVQIVADDMNDALVIRGVGAAGDTIRWVATVRTAEVGF